MKKMFAIVGVFNYLMVAFLNAFTDLGHKIIIQNTIFKVYDGEVQIILTAVINALILLPFILMFSPAGFLANKFAKHTIMKYSSVVAVVITLLITYSYYQGWFIFAFAMTFLLALQSAIYSPAKYGYIKELVGNKFITQGNGAIQAVTTVAILGGIIFYSAFFESMVGDRFFTNEDILKQIAPLGWFLVGGSIIEFYLASKLPNKMLKQSVNTFNFKSYFNGDYLYKDLKILKRKPKIFEAVLAISLFYSISQVILAIFGEYVKSNLGITNAMMVQSVMALAGIGIVFGSLIVSSFSKYYINTGMVVVGAFGITLCVFLIPFSGSMIVLAILFFLFGISAAFIIVPLNAYIQYLSPNVHFGTILAGNNFIQNIFMFSFLSLTTLFAFFGMDAKILFYIMGFIGVFLSILVLKNYAIMGVWTFVNIVFSIRFNFKYEGLENIPNSGGVLLLGNHVSWIDWLALQIPIKRRINFLMDKDIYNNKFLNSTLKRAKVIPISSKSFKDSFRDASNRLKDGNVVAIYPEGEITKDGELSKFQKGYELLTKGYSTIVVPYHIDGMFGSIFSKYKKDQKKTFFSRREIIIKFADPIPNTTKADELQIIIQKMKDSI